MVVDDDSSKDYREIGVYDKKESKRDRNKEYNVISNIIAENRINKNYCNDDSVIKIFRVVKVVYRNVRERVCSETPTRISND